MVSIRFDVSGPFKIPTTRHGAGKRVSKKELGDFWRAVAGDSLVDAKGCYVFAMRAGRPRTRHEQRTTMPSRPMVTSDGRLGGLLLQKDVVEAMKKTK